MDNSKDPGGPEGREPYNNSGADASADWTRGEEEDTDARLRDSATGSRVQTTASQAFGRDVGSSGLPGNAAPGEEGAGIFRKGAMGREHSDWTAVLGRLGGSSPGSEENLKLGDIFRRVIFPADRGQVLDKLDPGAEFSVKPGMALDVREAVELSRVPVFRNLNDLIDCIKDALRRADALERNPT